MLGHGIHNFFDFLMFFQLFWPPTCIHIHHTYPDSQVFHRFHLSGFSFFHILGYYTKIFHRFSSTTLVKLVEHLPGMQEVSCSIPHEGHFFEI